MKTMVFNHFSWGREAKKPKQKSTSHIRKTTPQKNDMEPKNHPIVIRKIIFHQ